MENNNQNATWENVKKGLLEAVKQNMTEMDLEEISDLLRSGFVALYHKLREEGYNDHMLVSGELDDAYPTIVVTPYGDISAGQTWYGKVFQI